jgi:hypothetical protein
MYKLLAYHQKAGQNCHIKIGSRLLEIVSHFRYLGLAAKNQNLIQDEIRRKLSYGNSCYHSVQNLLSPLLLSKNI